MPRLGRARPARAYFLLRTEQNPTAAPAAAAVGNVVASSRIGRRRGRSTLNTLTTQEISGIQGTGRVTLRKYATAGPVYPIVAPLITQVTGGMRRHRVARWQQHQQTPKPVLPYGGLILPAYTVAGTGIVPPPPPPTPFPQAILGIVVELLVNGTWNDITAFVYQRDDMVLSGGQPDETTSIEPGQMTLTLNNQDGRFSSDNENGAYWPFIQRNVQLRVSIATTFADQSQYFGYRFWGEVSEWPPTQDSTGNDQYAQITVSGVLRRYVQGATIGSALRRYYNSLTGTAYAPYAAWGCEDGTSATEFGSLVAGVPGMGFTGMPGFASDASFGGSDPIPVIQSSEWHGQTLAAASPPGAGSLTETTPGTYQWTCPPGVTKVAVQVIGGGGGGAWTGTGAGGGGGGGGEYAAVSAVAVTPGVTYNYVVPAGGAPGTLTTSASAGNDAAFFGDTVTVTAHGGQPGNAGSGNTGGAGGAGGSGSGNASHLNGGAGGTGEVLAAVTSTKTLTGSSGASGGASAGQAGSASQVWIAPTGTTTVTVEAVGPGGGGGSSYGTTSGGTGGGGGAYAAGSVDVTAGQPYTFYAGNGGAGASAGAVPGHRGETGGGTFVIGDSSSVAATGGAGGGPAGGFGEGGTVSDGTGNGGGQGGTGALSTTAAGGGGGGGGNRGFPGNAGGAGGNGSGRTPGAGNGAGGKGGWGQIYTGSGAGSGQTAGQTGNQTGSPGGGGGAAGATKQQTDAAGGGGAGQITWSWTNNAATGGGGGSSAGTGGGGVAGSGDGGGAVAPAGGGSGGNMDTMGAAPGGGGGGMDPAGTAPGAGAAGQVYLQWSGGSASPVAADIIRFLLHIDAAGAVDGAVVARAVTFGTIQNLDVIYHTAASGSLELKGYTGATTYFDSGDVGFACNGVPMCIDVQLVANGTGATWHINAIHAGATSQTGLSGNVSSVTVGQVSDVYCDPAGAVTDTATAAGWFTVQTYAETLEAIAQVINGFDGELAADRISRLCAEEGIGFELIGSDTDTPAMGPQQDDKLTNVIQSCVDADCGLLWESRDQLGLTYRTRLSMCGQSPVMILDWSAGQLAQPAPVPVKDDQWTRNDITLTRNNGSSASVSLNDGSLMSISDPPDGVGDYTYSLTVFLQSDGQLQYCAAWKLAVGTVPGYRFPQVTVNLASSEIVSQAVAAATAQGGDFMQIVNAPPNVFADLISQVVYGWQETINAFKWTIAFNEVPEAPYANPPQIVNSNSDFSAGTAGWTVYQGTQSVTASPPAGCPATDANLLTPSASVMICAIEETAAPVAAVPGQAFSVSAYVYTAGSEDVELGMDWRDGSGGFLQTSTQHFAGVTTGEWVLLRTQVTAPLTATVAEAVPRCGRNGNGTNINTGSTTYIALLEAIYPVTTW